MSSPCAAGAAHGLVCSETSRPLPEPPALATIAGEIVSRLSQESRRFGRMRRVILTSGRLLVDTFRGRSRWWMVTLTYRDDVEWAPGQISECMNRIRKYLARRKLPARYVWCLEGVDRLSGDRLGECRPHYHVLIQLPHGFSMPKPDKQGWWLYGWTNTKAAIRPVGYLAKYASKAGGGISWRGARCYGVSGLQANHRAVLSFWRAPRWVRAAYSFCTGEGAVSENDIGLPVRRLRGGWVWLETGEIVKSPTVPKWWGGVLCFIPRGVA
jgi:hypothetical protein